MFHELSDCLKIESQMKKSETIIRSVTSICKRRHSVGIFCTFIREEYFISSKPRATQPVAVDGNPEDCSSSRTRDLHRFVRGCAQPSSQALC